MIICPDPTVYIAGTIIEKARFAKIFHQMVSMEGKSPMDALVKLQTQQGIDEQTAKENAAACILAVAGRETVFEQTVEDAAAPMDRLFEKLEKKDAEERLQALHRIYFGLTIQSDPGYTGKGSDIEQMFRSYYAQAANTATPEEMEDRIRQALQGYRVSPAATKLLAHELKNSKKCLATAAAMGESGRNLKCLMTMELWLKNQDTMSMEQAANTACANADYQAVADAVRKGYIARSVAMKILKAIGITLLVAGIAYIAIGAWGTAVADTAMQFIAEAPASISNAELMPLFQKASHVEVLAPVVTSIGIDYAIFGVLTAALSKAAASLIGTVSAWITGKVQSAEEAAPAMDALAEEVEAEAAVQTEAAAQAAPAQTAPVQDVASSLSDAILFEEEDEEDEDDDVLIGF